MVWSGLEWVRIGIDNVRVRVGERHAQFLCDVVWSGVVMIS
jgi:hypothetical protein